MNPIPSGLLDQGIAYHAFRKQIEKNLEAFDDVYANPTFDDDDLAFLARLPELTVVAIAEDWCPDVFHTLPTWARLVEALPGWRLAIFPRGRHPDLMATFLHRGEAQRIPTYAFYDRRRYLQAWWSGRGQQAERDLVEILDGRAFKDLDPESLERAKTVFTEGYPSRYRRANLDEILALLSAFFHVSRQEIGAGSLQP